MPAFHVVLIVATVLCSLVAGFLFAFAVVVMPGTANLEDRDFIRSFREIDGVIQRRQPIFGLVWLGSVLALGVGLAMGIVRLAGVERLLLVLAGGIYFLGVQLPTVAINVPLNNALQALDVDSMDPAALRTARNRFEPRWNRWNVVRTVLAVVASAALAILLLRL